MDSLPADKRDDQVCFLRTLRAFRSYSRHALLALENRERSYAHLTDRQVALLGGPTTLGSVLEAHRIAIQNNQQFLNQIADSAPTLYHGYWPNAPNPQAIEQELHPTPLDMDKVYSTLRQFARDWSDEGQGERQSVYSPIQQLVARELPDTNSRILVPGAGLSRLSVELATHGYSVQGNEFSYHMLIAGHFAMNHCQTAREHHVNPYADTTVNLFSRRDQFRMVEVPDTSCYDFIDQAEQRGLEFGDLSMVAGDFIEVFSKPEQRGAWDCVVTCFFIDTAHNIVEYLEILFDLLKPGGVWINAGPLLHHFSDHIGEVSIDLSYEEVKEVAQRLGFEWVEEHTLTTSYTNNRQSMKQMVYHCPFFLCRKPKG